MDENKQEAYIGACYDELKAIRQNLQEMNQHLHMIAAGVWGEDIKKIAVKWDPETRTYKDTKKSR